MDLTKPWCTYRTTHPTGLYYEGKGKTAAVGAGNYKGSGTRFSLAITLTTYAFDTWSTEILDTFETETEAYEAEANLVTLESLADPMRLNMHAGGQKSMYKTPGALLKMMKREKAAKARQEKAARAKLRKQKEKEKLAALKKKLKEKQ